MNGAYRFDGVMHHVECERIQKLLEVVLLLYMIGGNLIVSGVGELLLLEGVDGVVGVVGVWGVGLVGVVGTLLQLGDRDFQAVRRHFVRRFWNQILIWFSVSPSLSAKICLSCVERYWETWNAFSSSSICVPEKVARPFFCDFFFSSSTDW